MKLFKVLRMKKIFLSLLVMIAINQSFAQFHSGTLKVREASFLKGERSVSIELTNLERKTPLTCENVTGGPYYYFLLTPTDDWTWDQEFVKEILQKISLNQDGKKLRATWYEPLPKDKETPFFLVGFDKTFKLNKEFNISMTFDKSSSTVTFKIAMQDRKSVV